MQGKIRVYCYLFEAMIEYYVERRAQGFGDVLCRLKLTRIPRQDSQASLELSCF